MQCDRQRGFCAPLCFLRLESCNLFFLFYKGDRKLMSTCRIVSSLHIDRKMELFLLAFFSCCGAVLAVAVSGSSELSISLMMRMAASSHVSIVGLMFSASLPFLITVVAYCFSKPFLLFPISFIKTFSYTLAICSVRIGFLQAGWLVCMLLLFSDTAAIVVLYWHWIRNIHGFRDSALTEMLFCTAVALVVTVIDYIWVSPFLMALISN